MTQDADTRLSGRALGVVGLPARQARPRTRGLTVAADRGMGRNAQADLIETAGEFIDVAKFAMGFARLMPPELVRAKIAAYGAADIPVFLAGEISELAVMRGQAAEYFAAVRDLGAWGVEVSNAQVAMDPAAKVALIGMARQAGLEVVAECGRKGGIGWADSTALVSAEVAACLDAGAWRVLVQAEGLNEDVPTPNEKLISDLIARFGLETLIFQAKESDLLSWFLVRFGSGVSLDVDADQVLDLELRRRGLRKRGVFGMMAGDIETGNTDG
jgi:phosphosulfolactate synthase